MPAPLESAPTCRVVTTGRASGEPHQVTVWFALDGSTVYILSRHGEDADWVRNVAADPVVQLVCRRTAYRGTAEVVRDPAQARRGRQAMYDKYSPKHRGLEAWLEGGATVVAVRLGS